MASVRLQLLAFALAVSGACGVLAATLLPSWQVSVAAGASILSAVEQLQGLWMDCTWYSTGMFSCALRVSTLALPLHVQAARAAMVLACVLAALGICAAPVGMRCTRLGGDREDTKRHAALAAGACFLGAGLAGAVPPVWYTREMVATFLDLTVPEGNKPEPGAAVYAGFVSALLLLVAGWVFCGSGARKRPEGRRQLPKQPLAPDKATYHLEDYV
ncbi:claudin-20 [Sorex araneus]|uniref:claudin-20 n=1 Tax=Sorex araneus TaxID=42254 RepID=UPI002433BE83|nr:claudin-20 [Sorex araneus]